MLEHYVIEAIEKILAGDDITAKLALKIVNEAPFDDLLYGANYLRKEFKGNKINFCSIVNARSGLCPEDCHFCAQSSHYETNVDYYPLQEKETIFTTAQSVNGLGAVRFGIVTSGRGVVKNIKERDSLCQVIKLIAANTSFQPCGSFGILDAESAQKFKQAGLRRYNHNLETARDFFPRICSTHTYDDRIQTLLTAREAGLQICSGGIFGLGEGWNERIALAIELRKLKVDSVPLNFLYAIPGTPLADTPPLSPQEILSIIAIYRYLLPDKDIRICGGREKNLGDFQSWMYYAGANGALLGNYLTTTGRPPTEDLKLARDLGLEWW